MQLAFDTLLDEDTPHVGPDFGYRTRDHSACHTRDYVFSQLIPYLGNKRKLLTLIEHAVRLTGVESGLFADVFAGSGVVSRWAKQRGFRVASNDWEPYAEPINGCYIGLNEAPPDGESLLAALNDPGLATDGYITRNYCPADDSCPEPDKERCFYTRANGRRLDGICEQIAAWEAAGAIDAGMKAYLVAPLLYAASYVSNTSGVFKAYHNGWGGQTGTALYRILSDIGLQAPVLLDNGRANIVTRLDAEQFARDWPSGEPMDVAYLDPPYNQHPYSTNYHVLNTIALWDCPPVGPIARGSKSAIRTDWRTDRRSPYNSATCALPALEAVIDALPTPWVLLSYSTEGNIPADRLCASLAARGALRLVMRRYKRYRVSTQRMSLRPHTVEFVAVLDREGMVDPGAADRCLDELRQAEEGLNR
ncbi:MAG: DNA adenine methylase [Capsulimonadaceae bacterium]